MLRHQPGWPSGRVRASSWSRRAHAPALAGAARQDEPVRVGDPASICPTRIDARQARELDPKKREALVHRIQTIIRDKVTAIPLFEQAFIWGVGPRVAEAGDAKIPGFGYSAPFEDLQLKR